MTCSALGTLVVVALTDFQMLNEMCETVVVVGGAGRLCIHTYIHALQ